MKIIPFQTTEGTKPLRAGTWITENTAKRLKFNLVGDDAHIVPKKGVLMNVGAVKKSGFVGARLKDNS